MNLNKCKIFLKSNTPSFIFDTILNSWRTGFLSPLRLRLEKYRYSKEVKPYFKNIIFRDLNVDIFVDVKESWVSRELDLRGIHEEHILENIIDNLSFGSVFIDVGANVGQHTLFAAKKVGVTGKVFAFEPIPSTAEGLRKSKVKNNFSWLTIIQKAVSDKTEKTVFYKYGLTDISSKNPNFDDRPCTKLEVEQTTLDICLLEENKIDRVDLIKIDVEGFEYDVLVGAKKVIENFSPKIILEFSPVFYSKLFPEHSRKILEFFLKQGYTITDIDNQKGEVKDVDSYLMSLLNSGNISNLLCEKK